MLEAVGVEVVKKAVEAAGKEIAKKASEAAALGKKIAQMPETAEGMKEVFKDKLKDGMKKGVELAYDQEAKDDPDLAELKSAFKAVEGIAKDLGEKLKQVPEAAQEVSKTDVGKEGVREGIKIGAELIYDQEAEDDPDLAELKNAFKAVEGVATGVGEKSNQGPETAQKGNVPLEGNGDGKAEDIKSDMTLHNREVEKSEPDQPELTKEEKIKLQDQAISEVEKGEKTIDSTQEKGNYGEMKTDQDLREKGYERISNDMVTDVNDSGHQGIDGVYYNPNGVPQYLIADSKFGTGQLSDTLDGKQMSDNWIDKRLDESVGKEKADEIRMEKLLNPDNVGSYVSHVDEKGNVSYDKLDGNANIIEKDVKI